jgi:hypothetical protein
MVRKEKRRQRHRWEDNIKINFQEVGWGGMDWTDFVLDRDRWQTLTCECSNERSRSIKCGKFLD